MRDTVMKIKERNWAQGIRPGTDTEMGQRFLSRIPVLPKLRLRYYFSLKVFHHLL